MKEEYMDSSQIKKRDNQTGEHAPLLRELSVEIVEMFKDVVVSGGRDSQVERKSENGEDKQKREQKAYPNLKYRKPKYNSMDSVLKYIESDDGENGGIKLIIMNFND